MGFDLYMARPPANVSGYEPQYEGMPEYFRVTSATMPALVAAMERAGVVDLAMPTPRLPTWPPGRHASSSPPEDTSARPSVEPPSTASELAILDEFRERRLEVLGARSPERSKVPAFKFASNDGWRISPEECRAIADGLTHALTMREAEVLDGFFRAGGALSRVDARAFLDAFARYNAVAAEHDGYRVD